MPSAKEQIAKILQDQPDDSSYDELLRELTCARMIDRGLSDSDTGKTIRHEEMGRRINPQRLADTFRQLRSPTFLGMASGCFWP